MASDADQRLALDYVGVRRAVGIVGAILPLALLVGGYVAWGGLRPSISHYHGTGLRDVFVGLLCAVGVFLFSYQGFRKGDYYAGPVAGALAVAVAFFPNTGRTTTLHFAAAAGFFVVLALTSLLLFTRSSVEDKERRPKGKRRRNAVYLACGWGILACLALIAAYKAFLDGGALDAWAPVFWLEAIAIWFFAASWLVKGEALRTPAVPRPVREFFAEGERPKA
jgi:hypothetical protein